MGYNRVEGSQGDDVFNSHVLRLGHWTSASIRAPRTTPWIADKPWNWKMTAACRMIDDQLRSSVSLIGHVPPTGGLGGP